MKSATLALLVLAASLSSWSLTNLPANAVSSSKHYRESGVGNATGRAGSAIMTARALLSKDGSTTVEVTTGTFDSTNTPPGNFRKVQFKLLSTSGDELPAQNFFPATAGGYYSFSAALPRGAQIQLQGNISDIDRNRTDVVTLVETVKARPDLAVEKLAFPGSAFVNQAVNISANIVEMNGDAGATTTCVLAIDGNNVDQMNNVYVDAAGSVSCAFVYTFKATGAHTIQVTAANVAPADWNTSNNSNSGTINIASPISAEHSFATFEDENGGFPVITASSYQAWYFGSLIENNSSTSGKSGRTQNSSALFYSSGCNGSTNAIAWQFPANVTYTESMDGTSVYSFTDTGISGNSIVYSGYNFPTCGGTVATENVQYGSDYADDHWNYLSSYQYEDGAGNPLMLQQSVQIERYAGDVTYFSYQYQCYYLTSPSGTCNSPSDYYTWNSSGQDVNGTLVPLGSTWVPTVATQDAAGNTFSGSISVPLASTQQIINQPNTCSNYGPDSSGYSYQSCSSQNYNATITEGSASN